MACRQERFKCLVLSRPSTPPTRCTRSPVLTTVLCSFCLSLSPNPTPYPTPYPTPKCSTTDVDAAAATGDPAAAEPLDVGKLVIGLGGRVVFEEGSQLVIGEHDAAVERSPTCCADELGPKHGRLFDRLGLLGPRYSQTEDMCKVNVPYKHRLCTPCAHGSISTAYNVLECDVCEAGRHADAPHTECTDCELGRFHESQGQACKTCQTGKYAHDRNMLSCLHCPSGKYQDAEVYDKCDECAYGKWTADSISGPMECVLIPTPYPTPYPTLYPTPACILFSVCAACAASCTISSVYNAASCTACAVGQFAVATETECTDCRVGRYRECKTCEAGRFAEGTASVSCLHCPSGKYQDGDAYHSATCVRMASGRRALPRARRSAC